MQTRAKTEITATIETAAAMRGARMAGRRSAVLHPAIVTIKVKIVDFVRVNSNPLLVPCFIHI
jgi:hypothetical protein